MLARVMAQEREATDWFVYRLLNHTSKEVWFGATNLPGRIPEPGNGGVAELAAWDFEDHVIVPSTVKVGLTQAEALELAHRLEKSKVRGFESYAVIQIAEI